MVKDAASRWKFVHSGFVIPVIADVSQLSYACGMKQTLRKDNINEKTISQ